MLFITFNLILKVIVLFNNFSFLATHFAYIRTTSNDNPKPSELYDDLQLSTTVTLTSSYTFPTLPVANDPILIDPRTFVICTGRDPLDWKAEDGVGCHSHKIGDDKWEAWPGSDLVHQNRVEMGQGFLNGEIWLLGGKDKNIDGDSRIGELQLIIYLET